MAGKQYDYTPIRHTFHSLMFVLLNGGGVLNNGTDTAVQFHSLMFVLLNGGPPPTPGAGPPTFHSLMFVLLNGGPKVPPSLPTAASRCFTR